MNATVIRRIFAVAPITVFILSIVLINVRGPFYVGGHIDPEYMELGNSLSAVMFHVPVNTDHPGTTLHVLGALVITCKWLMSSVVLGTWQPVEDVVLRDPEGFLRAINLVINVILGLSMYYSARELHRQTGSVVAALALQLSFFLFPENLYAVTRVSPEPLLQALIFILMVPLARLIFAGESMTEAGLASTVRWAGVILGAGLVTKLTLLPFCGVVLIIKGYKQKLLFTLSAVGTFLLFFLPSLPKLPQRMSYFASFVTHTGYYGNGPIGVPPAAALLKNLSAAYDSAPLLFPLFVLYVVVLIVVGSRRTGQSPSGSNIVPVLIAGCTGIFIHTALTIQHFQTHYLIPSLVFVCFLNAVLVARFERARVTAAPKLVLVALGAGIGLVGLTECVRAVSGWGETMRLHREEVAILMDRVDSMPKCIRVGYYLSSLPLYALHFANFMAGRHHTSSLSRLYPGAVFYARRGTLENFNGDDMSAAVADLLRGGQCFTAEGLDLSPADMPLPPALRWDKIYARSGEAVYSLALTAPSGTGK